MSNEPLSEQYYHAGKEWAELNAAASMLEEGRSAFLSQASMKLIESGFAVSKADAAARASKDYSDYVKSMVKRREEANLAKIKMEVLRMRFWEWQSEAATERTQARL